VFGKEKAGGLAYKSWLSGHPVALCYISISTLQIFKKMLAALSIVSSVAAVSPERHATPLFH